jgi:hypothetical protein
MGNFFHLFQLHIQFHNSNIYNNCVSLIDFETFYIFFQELMIIFISNNYYYNNVGCIKKQKIY